MKLSVVIPVYNESKYLEKTLSGILKINPYEIIVVDGGSLDNSLDIAKKHDCKIIMAKKGRGIQIERGIENADGDTILVLHADAFFPNDVSLRDFELNDNEVGGFFKLKFISKSFCVKLVEIFANFRSYIHSLPYGDQAIFFKKDVCKKIGGFRDYPFLEDLDFVLRLRKVGKIKRVNKNVCVSARKLERRSFLYPLLHSWKNVVIVFLYFLGIKPQTLAKYYK